MPNNDYIKRSEAVARLTGKACCVNSPGKVRAFATAINVIETMPAADVKPVRHGRWIEVDDDYAYDENVYRCSECGEEWDILEGTPLQNMYYHCPKCGAKMDAELPKGEDDG